MTLSHQRRFTMARPDEGWPEIARRVLPETAEAEALDQLRSWNLHLFMRQPKGRILGADVIFTEPPRGD